jgi:hypothetical protein
MNVLAWLTAGVAGWAWVRVLMPRQAGPAWARLGFEAGLALAFGTGAAAALFFLLIWLGMKPAGAAWTADVLVLAGGGALWLLMRGKAAEAAPAEPARPLPLAWVAGLAAAVSVLAFLAAVAVYLRANPQGDWDAWGAWNVRARMLVSEGLWRNAVSSELSEARPELPLLWPAAVARAWAESGEIAQTAPQAGAFFMSAALILIFALGASLLTGWAWGALAAAALLTATPLWRHAAGQGPEIPAAVFVLAAVITAAAAERARWSAAGLVLSGALAGWASFTGNDGLVGCAALLAALAAASRTRAAWWLAGASPGLALTLAFHFLLSPSKALFGLEGFSQAGRLGEALQAAAAGLWQLGDFPAHPFVFVLLLFVVFRPDRPWRPSWPALAGLLMAAGGLIALWGAAGGAAPRGGVEGARLWLTSAPVLLLAAFMWLARPREPAAFAEAAEGPARPKAVRASGAKQ